MSAYREFLECFKKNYVEKNCTFVSTCKACGYSPYTIYEWKRKNQAFKEKIEEYVKRRKAFDESKLVEKASTGLTYLCDKTKRKSKEQYWESLKDEKGNVILDKKGKPQMQLVSERLIEREYPPNITAITFILQNLDKESYGREEVIDLINNINRSMTLEVVHTNKQDESPEKTDEPQAEGDAE